MTKQAMITAIQLQEATAWLSLKQAEKMWGADEVFIRTTRARWTGIYDTMTALGIVSDWRLSANKEATAIICERVRQAEAERVASITI